MKEFVNSFLDYDIIIPEGKTGDIDVICPQCSHLRKPHNQKIPVLGVHTIEGYWHCNHCGWKGHLLTSDYVRSNKEYKLPEKEATVFQSEKILRFFLKRKITEPTLRYLRIGELTDSIYQKYNKLPELIGKFAIKYCIVFNYFRDGVLIHYKLRDDSKNFRTSKDTELIFYNIDSVKGTKYAIITEGEIDVASYIEAGIKPVVSVPNGANISKKELEHFHNTGRLIRENQQNLIYLDNCYEYFDDKEVIYIATDDDPAGIKLRDELARRLGYDRCKLIQFGKYEYTDNEGKKVKCKDANDVLVNLGPETLHKTLEDSIPYPIDDVIRLDSVRFIMMDQYKQGKIKGLPTGWPALDPHFRWRFGEVSLMNGYYNNGKTSMIFNFVVGSAILYGFKWSIYSPENYPVQEAYDTLYEIYVGNTSDIERAGRMSEKEYSEAMDFIQKHIYLIGSERRYSAKDLREITLRMIKQFGINGVITDPWKALKHPIQDFGNSYDLYLENELQEEIDFATKYRIIKLIAVHPPTPIRNKEKEYPAPSGHEIKGGEAWASQVHNMLCIHIPQTNTYEDTLTEFHVQKIKNQKLVGVPTRQLPVPLFFNRRSQRYHDVNGKSPYDQLTEKSNQLKIEDF